LALNLRANEETAMQPRDELPEQAALGEAKDFEEREELLRRAILVIRERYQPTTSQLLRFLGVGNAILVRLFTGRHVTPSQLERMWDRVRGDPGSLAKKDRPVKFGP
jgi:hypothetical protein